MLGRQCKQYTSNSALQNLNAKDMWHLENIQSFRKLFSCPGQTCLAATNVTQSVSYHTSGFLIQNELLLTNPTIKRFIDM